MLIINIRLLL